VESVFVQGLPADEDLTGLKFAPDGRLFVTHRAGDVLVIKDGILLPQPFVTVDADTAGTEYGLVGIAFDPDFQSNGYVYLSYTARSPTTHQRVSRFTARGDFADPASEVVLLELGTIRGGAHVGGGMAFGPDGKLYIGVGEALVASNSQSLDTGYGKMLRINRDGSIPADNPFYEIATGRNRAIWALGLRNPFSFAFDAQTGRMLINDTGAVTFEEINEGIAGANYGWPETDGYSRDPRFTGPLHVYPHGPGQAEGCAIDAGTFYRPAHPTFPRQYVGMYFFMDFCNNWIRVLDPDSGSVTGFAKDLYTNNRYTVLVGLEVGPDGALYWINRSDSAIYRLQYTGTLTPYIGKEPADLTVQAGSPATLEVRASGDALTYQWQRNGVDIPDATSSVLVLPAPLPVDSGSRFRCIVANGLGRVMSESAMLTVVPPSATYDSDPPQTWTVGETRSYEVLVTNTGLGTWNAGGLNIVRLGVHFGGDSDEPNNEWQTDERFTLPRDVPVGASITIPVTVTAPLVPGDYVLRHRMIKELVVWFDQIEMMNVTVTREFRLPVLLSLAGATGLMVLGPALLAFLVVVGRAGRLRRLIEIAWP
jgi:glucose/arabinose dehydrogenase